MSAVAEAFDVARSNLYDSQKEDRPIKRRKYGKRRDDEFYLSLIHPIDRDLPTYGYPRVTVLLNRELERIERPIVNPKRVYRIMRVYGLLLQKHTGKPTRTHNGVIITLRSDMRWCSDTLEIGCWNGQKVRMAFSLDCCDREVISHLSATSGISGEMIRDLMLESVEGRFGAVEKLPKPIEWLSDNGSIYTAHETRDFALKLGFIPCRTPVYSPESNGMAEAFVKTFKRDYVQFGDLTDAETVMLQIPRWVEHYNEVHPHRGLKMKSPREFRKSQMTA